MQPTKTTTESKQPLSRKEKVIIQEICRRINQFKNGDKSASMVYLGYPSEVKTLTKKDILTPYYPEKSRVLNWYNLTAKGQSYIS